MIYTDVLKAVVCYSFDDVVDAMDVDLDRLTPVEDRTLDDAYYFFTGMKQDGEPIPEQMQVVCDLNRGIAMVCMRDLRLLSVPEVRRALGTAFGLDMQELSNTTIQEVLDFGDNSKPYLND